MEVRDPFIGTILDRRYRIEERIAAGGFGAIYRAVHVRSEMQLAIKVLHPRLSADERIVARFRREGATLTSLRSPHTVTTYELAEDPNGTLFIVMELLRGQTLLERFQSGGPLPWRRVVAMARAVCDALAEAHALGVVHRDLKPANIHLSRLDDDDQFVKVLDFGIAKLLRGSGIDESNEELTNHNEVIGTFEYISPEQIAGDSYSGRSDIYTLGIVMFEMATGSRPFGNLTGPALMATIFSEVARPPSTKLPGLPPAFDALVLRCLARDPDARYADVHVLAAALDDLSTDRDVTGESATAIGSELDLRIAHGDESTSIATPRADWASEVDSVETQTVRKPGSPSAETPTAPDPFALLTDRGRDREGNGRDSNEIVTPLERTAPRSAIGAAPPLTAEPPPLEKTVARPSRPSLPVSVPLRRVPPPPTEQGYGAHAERRSRSPSHQPAYPPAPGSLAPGPLPAFGEAPRPSTAALEPQRAPHPLLPVPRDGSGRTVQPRPSTQDGSGRTAQPMLPPARPARTSQPPPMPRPSQPAHSPPQSMTGLAGGREPLGATAPGMGVKPVMRLSPAALPSPVPGTPGLLHQLTPPRSPAQVSPEALSTVFSTLEGWQAPPIVPVGLVAADPAKAVADRERHILVWAAVLGVAILIGVILAVAV